ncbi:Defensin-like protein 106 [Arabidopsis thaliana]
MANTPKTLIAFVFSVIVIISYVHCHTTIASAPSSGEPTTYATGPALSKHSHDNDGICFVTPACFAPGQYEIGCIVYCHESHYKHDKCVNRSCCCYNTDKNASELK